MVGALHCECHSSESIVESFKKVGISEFLPAISVTNMRSLRPKLQSFIQDFRMRELSVACLSETWGKDDKRVYRNKIVAMFQKEGLGVISLNRKVRRGGGVALIFDTETMHIEELDVIVPNNLEVVWGLRRQRRGPLSR